MSKTCYVIMPFGGEDESKRKRFKAIFSAIIKPAAENKGYTVIREDHEARQGNISANIIRSLGEADIVIADLSESNWNVAYELGIRHTLCKCGTVLLTDDQTQLKFDIQGNKVIKYSHTWYESIDEVQQQIMESIDYLEKNRTGSDSPVHDVYPKFAVRLTDYLENNNDREKALIAQLTQENAQLRTLVNNAGLSTEETKEQSNISETFRDALSRSQYAGKKALVKLQEHLQAQDEEGFVNVLATILSKGFLTEIEVDRVYWMCKQLDNYFVLIAFLEEAIRRYPDKKEFSGRLAREYARNAENREKAILTVNKNVGVRKTDGRYSVEPKTVSYNVLASFFDVYIELEKYADMLEICPLLKEAYPGHSELISRNIITANRLLGKYDVAEQLAMQLVANNPSAINHYSLYNVYRVRGQYVRAYEQIEACVSKEPTDKDYLLIAAGLIIDFNYVRTQNGEIMKVAHPQAVSAAAPLVFEAFANKGTYAECMDFLQRNNMLEAAKVLATCQQQGLKRVPKTGDFDYYPLEYCLR